MKIFETFAGLEQMMDFHLERHGVLAANLANAETPGYQPKEIRFAEHLESLTVDRTDAEHLPVDEQPAPSIVVEQGDPVGPDDNGVRLEKAMAQVAANRVRYEAAIEVTRRRLALLRYAATDGNS